MLGVYTDTKELEKNKYRSGYFARLTTEGIEVYNTEGELQEYYTNPSLSEVILVDSNYYYCLCEGSQTSVEKFDLKREKRGHAKGAAIK